MAAIAIVLTTLALPIGPAAADQTFDQHMLDLLNRDRAANGIGPLVADPTLSASAEDAPYTGCGFPVNGRAMDMGQRNYFSHTILGCGMQGVFNILTSTGLVYSGAGENIAWANALTDPLVAAENLESQLMNSRDHRANILNPTFTKVGVGSWHTSPGQTWSGGGFTLLNVYIGVQIFAGGAVTAPPPAPAGAGYHPVTPSRILDTRVGNGAPTAPIGPGATLNLQVSGRGGVPTTGVSAVVMTVTVTAPTAAGYLTVFPTGEAMPMASNLNFVSGQTVPNLVMAKLGGSGQVSIYSPVGTVQVIADVAGWYDTGAGASGARFHALTPSRILDSRYGNGLSGALSSGAAMNLQVTGRGGVPSTGVSAVVLNVTVTAPTASSYLTVFPTGAALPMASNLNFDAGQTIPNLVTAKLGTGGQLSLFNAVGTTHVVGDIAGWYGDASTTGGATFHALTPSRLLDSRYGNGLPGPLGAGEIANLQVTGRGGVPSTGVSAVVLNVAVTAPTASSFLTVFPTGEALPMAANLNFVSNQTVPNLVVAKVGANGRVALYNSVGSTHVVADVAGWYDVG